MQSHRFYSHYREIRPTEWSYFLTQTALNKVQIGVDYSYIWAGKRHHGSRLFKKQTFLNDIVATDWIDAQEKIPKKLYINPSKPSDALLERTFPWKAGTELILIAVSALYFAYLRSYVSKYS